VPALSYPATEVRRHDRDRFLCSLFAPVGRRDALLALYAFNSAIARVRETVSEPLIGEIRLQWWWDRIAAIYDGIRPDDELAAALADAVSTHGLSRVSFETLIEGRRRDLDDRPLDDIADLTRYAERTSVALNGLALEVLGVCDDAAALAAGRHAGIAWTMVGVIRAVPFHGAQGRFFLPSDICLDCGIDPASPNLRSGEAAIAAVVRRIAGLAADHLEQARSLKIPREAVPVLLPATLASADLAVLRKTGFDPFDGRNGLRGAGRLLRLAFNGFRGRF
jgi:NADH dehydrogenase [ubiquinone] 1 alpha subcomplex assembly factor 6